MQLALITGKVRVNKFSTAIQKFEPNFIITEGLRVFRAERAASKAGIASARSAEHSSAIAFEADAASLATFSSAATI